MKILFASRTKRLLEKLRELLMDLVIAIIIAICLMTFAIGHTKVPTASMVPTINPGDHLVINPWIYRCRPPQRGEIVVFRLGGKKLIKRIIGTPGDVVDIIENRVYINGTPLDESAYLDHSVYTYIYAGSKITFPYLVPEGYYFVLGDNRKNSEDSRVFGPIAAKAILAQAGFRIYPLNKIGMVK